MIVHVVSFSPNCINDEVATGGFEWRYSLEDAKATFLEFFAEDYEHFNLSFVHVNVPNGLTPEQTTEWLDDRLYIFEPVGEVNHRLEPVGRRSVSV